MLAVREKAVGGVLSADPAKVTANAPAAVFHLVISDQLLTPDPDGVFEMQFPPPSFLARTSGVASVLLRRLQPREGQTQGREIWKGP